MKKHLNSLIFFSKFFFLKIIFSLKYKLLLEHILHICTYLFVAFKISLIKSMLVNKNGGLIKIFGI